MPRSNERVERASVSELTAIQTIDEQALGANRGEILNHLVKTGDVNVLRTNGRISGYAIVRPFGAGHVLGPLVAENENDALVLLHATLKPGEIRVDRFMEVELLGEQLNQLGLAGYEVANVMVRGDWPTLDARVHAFAMASHAWG